MSPQTQDKFIRLVLDTEMKALKSGNVRRFTDFNDSLKLQDKNNNELLKDIKIKIVND